MVQPVSMKLLALSFTAVLATLQVAGQGNPNLPNSFPHNYPGIPNTGNDFSDSAAWQIYFEVKDALPNITFHLQRSFAGNLPVNRKNHPNDTLFFWAFEKSYGSLTSKDNAEPWMIWLNGGPGSSSLIGLLLENGPIHFNPDFTAFHNNYTWSDVVDTVWIDQPVGTGFSTSDNSSYVVDEDQMGTDFMGFLSNLVQVFPSLKRRPLYLAGESYAGVYIPYIVKTYFSLDRRPVHLKKIIMGDGIYGDIEVDFDVQVLSVIKTYPQLINYDTEVYEYFKEQTHLCKMDINLTYPQNGTIPTITPVIGGMANSSTASVTGKRNLFQALTRLVGSSQGSFAKRDDENARRAWKRGLAGRANGTIDPWYGCDLFDELVDFALNATHGAWSGHSLNGFDYYYIPDALLPEGLPSPNSIGVFLNDPRVATALHAPTSKNWTASFFHGFGYPFGGGPHGDPSPSPMNFFSELATNLSRCDIGWVFSSGNKDYLLAHRGTEIVIQNTTFEEIQGFTQRPSTAWINDAGDFLGIVHQERHLTYVLFKNAGHMSPRDAPQDTLLYLKEFILGNNSLGTVLYNGSTVGGTNSSLASGIIPAVSDPIFTGSGSTVGAFPFPSATVAAWNRFTQTALKPART